MTNQEFLDSLTPDQLAAATRWRDEINAANTVAMEAHRESLQGQLDADAATIATLNEERDQLTTDHAAELQSLRQEKDAERQQLIASHEEAIAALQGLPSPDSVKTISLQLALLAFNSSPDEVTQIINTVIPEQDENGVPLRAAALLRWSNLEGGVRRDHLLVTAVQAGLQWSDEKIDALFALARRFDRDADYVPVAEDLYAESE